MSSSSCQVQSGPAALRKPNLFVIGSMKAGTTYLAKLLGAHPAIFMCSPEEPSYFVDQRQLRRLWPEAWDQGFWCSEEHYLRLFQSGGDAALLGEASTNYTKLPMVPGVPERIRRFNPDARFIYLLRDPIERTISHYWHMVRYHAERRPIKQAIASEPQYLDVSYYAMQLLPFLDCFGWDRVTILTLEQLISAPMPTMRSLYEWLGVDGAAGDLSELVGRRENATPEVVRMAIGYGALQFLRKSRPMRAMISRVPRMVRQAGLHMCTTQVHRGSVSVSDVADMLRLIQRRQTEELARLLGRTFPEWTALHGVDAA